MSIEAVTWALKQPIKHSSAKFVLVALANCASAESGIAFPSVAYLASATSQDRKTVLNNLQRLIEWGQIEDTGKRCGATKQIVIYRVLCGADLFSEGALQPVGERSQNRNSSENGTVPKTAGNSTVFPPNSPKNGTRNRQEPSGNHQSLARRSASRFSEFWAEYPKREGRKRAEAKWNAKNLDVLADLIIADVKRRKAEHGRWLDGFVLDAVKYLGEERWEDEITPRAGVVAVTPSTTTPAPVPARHPLAPTETKLQQAIGYAVQQHNLGAIDDAELEQQIVAARAKHGKPADAQAVAA
ncbi:helix-turn-helix domain-containing protein [Luteimonas sp. SMYT11W]|uniref:Helix-turn-helix domain-containing protein n=1 Tax=Luteimonas flava TaxID=3115822 RepID=A0ABU7WE15_9GAMM